MSDALNRRELIRFGTEHAIHRDSPAAVLILMSHISEHLDLGKATTRSTAAFDAAFAAHMLDTGKETDVLCAHRVDPLQAAQ
jgi:hypothetical protein